MKGHTSYNHVVRAGEVGQRIEGLTRLFHLGENGR
jgi:hypothetical protein